MRRQASDTMPLEFRFCLGICFLTLLPLPKTSRKLGIIDNKNNRKNSCVSHPLRSCNWIPISCISGASNVLLALNVDSNSRPQHQRFRCSPIHTVRSAWRPSAGGILHCNEKVHETQITWRDEPNSDSQIKKNEASEITLHQQRAANLVEKMRLAHSFTASPTSMEMSPIKNRICGDCKTIYFHMNPIWKFIVFNPIDCHPHLRSLGNLPPSIKPSHETRSRPRLGTCQIDKSPSNPSIQKDRLTNPL